MIIIKNLIVAHSSETVSTGKEDKLLTSLPSEGSESSSPMLLLLLLLRSSLNANYSPVGYSFRGEDAEWYEKKNHILTLQKTNKPKAKSGGYGEQVHSYSLFIPTLSYTDAPS